MRKTNNSRSTKFTKQPLKIKKNSARHNSMTRLCRALFKYEMKRKSIEIIY